MTPLERALRAARKLAAADSVDDTHVAVDRFSMKRKTKHGFVRGTDLRALASEFLRVVEP